MNCSRGGFLRGAFAAGAVAATGGLTAVSDADGMTPVPPRRLRIAHLTDPQFGWGGKYSSVAENYAPDMACFERAAAQVNALAPDVAIITGDMTHEAASVATDWPRLLELFDVPVYVAPGNHDMGNTMTAENRDRYLGVFGCDRAAFDVKGWRFIVGNTQFLFGTALASEKAEYEEWLSAELRNAKGYGGRVVLAGHYPPFKNAYDEVDSYENHPRSLRYDRFAMYKEAGVTFYLAGHTHVFSVRGHEGITILNPETTMYGGACGFRMLEIYDGCDELHWSYNKENVSTTGI